MGILPLHTWRTRPIIMVAMKRLAADAPERNLRECLLFIPVVNAKKAGYTCLSPIGIRSWEKSHQNSLKLSTKAK